MMTFMYQAVSILLDASPHLWEGKLVHPHGPLYSSSGHHEIFELNCTDISWGARQHKYQTNITIGGSNGLTQDIMIHPLGTMSICSDLKSTEQNREQT